MGRAPKVNSKPGKGTTVKYFCSPLAEGKISAEQGGAPKSRHLELEGAGTILLVDDENRFRTREDPHAERIRFKVLLAAGWTGRWTSTATGGEIALICSI